MEICGVGMTTSVGWNVPSSCAALNCSIDNFLSSGYVDKYGEAIIVATPALNADISVEENFQQMLASAIAECLESAGITDTREIPLLVCLSETTRSRHFALAKINFTDNIAESSGYTFSANSKKIELGNCSVAIALEMAREYFIEKQDSYVLIACADTLLTSEALSYYQDSERLLSRKQSNGFIAGEAAAALLVSGNARHASRGLRVLASGFGKEPSPIGLGKPFKAQGLIEATRSALSKADLFMHDIDFRVSDITGEQYYFKEAALALAGTLRQVKDEFDILTPVDCVGNIGSAFGGVGIGWLWWLSKNNGAINGRYLMQLSNDSERRAVIVLESWG